MLDDDIVIESRVEVNTELLETFIRQRRLRCDLCVRDWRFEFLAVHKDYPNNLPVEFYVFVPNFRNPDDVSEEFNEALRKIDDKFSNYNIIPLYL